jgi:hypothetical protein
MDFSGQPAQITPLGEAHLLNLPTDRGTLPPRTRAALETTLAAQEKTRQLAGKKATPQDRATAHEELGAAWRDLNDTVRATRSSGIQHHSEAYELAALKLGRLLTDAEGLVQQLVVHSQLHSTLADDSRILFIDRKTKSRTVAKLRCLADNLKSLTDIPPIDA